MPLYHLNFEGEWGVGVWVIWFVQEFFQMVGPLQKMNCLNMALKTMSFSIFKKSIILHKQKTKEINVECVFISDKDRAKLYVHFFRPK